MLFNSLTFVAFLACVYAVYFALPGRQRAVLLTASLFFYAWWNPKYLGLVFASTIIDYLAAFRVAPGWPGNRRAWLVVSMSANLLILGAFKYVGFLTHNASAVLGFLGMTWAAPTLSIVLPLGVSFYTFQSMSYTIDVYRGDYHPISRYRDFLLSVTFFPHMVAGPIMRTHDLAPQFRDGVAPRAVWFAEGLTLMARGYAKKLFFADTLAPYVNEVFAAPAGVGAAQTLVAIYAFAVQIYGDFSGYTDIARGVARTLGYELTLNFDHPYQATSITDFWRRWHISLSSWLRDYLYIPLGGNRKGPSRTYANLMITMLLGGLWHGASWNFVIWGGLHGLYLSAERALGVRAAGPGEVAPWMRWARRLVVFHLVCLAWVFFRAETFDKALTILSNLASGYWDHRAVNHYAVALIVLGLAGSAASSRVDWSRLGRSRAAFAAVLLVLGLSLLIMYRRIPSEFIYFQF